MVFGNVMKPKHHYIRAIIGTIVIKLLMELSVIQEALAGGYSANGVCGGASYANCYTDYAADATSSISASSTFGTQAVVCAAGNNGQYCDDISDASFSPGNNRCDGSDTACRLCNLATGEDSEVIM
jgi:hypothetical protein